MATVEPFAGLRYNPALCPDLSAVTAPPYDVIGPALHADLLAEPRNIVHVDLNPGDPATRYETAAAILAGWCAEGVLVRDDQPALYVYEQQYDWGGELLTRRSILARVRLEPLGTGHIHPHERTFSGPKEDRFRLTVATRCVLSQHLGVYPDTANEVIGLLAAATNRAPDMTARGRDGVLNRLWVVTDPALHATVSAALADRDIFIADGHHRYETMLRYRDHLAADGSLADDHPAQYTSFVLVGSGDPGLCVMPTHRVVSGWPSDFGAVLALPGFTATRLDLDPRDAEALEAAVAAWPVEAVGLLTRDGVTLLQPDPALLDRESADLTPALRQLNVAVLHRLVLPRLETLGQPQIAYVHRVDEALAGLAEGAQAAFLLRATPLEAVLDVALAHELMPQKSTYFYPKVLTGLVLYPVG